MNLVITSSEFAKKTFESVQYEMKNPQGQTTGHVKLQTPIKVIFEGANTDVYKSITEPCMIDFDIKEEFAYLFVGHWMQGDFGEDRKNVGLLVKAFYETFKNKTKKPALILKTSGSGCSYMDRDEILKKINKLKKSVNSTNLPNVYLLHGEFTDEEMNSIYNHSKVKAMVSLTKGEGFGRPLLEFSLSKKPILTTNWSAHPEFLNSEYTTLMNGDLKNVHSSAVVQNMILAEAQWFNVNTGEVGYYLKDMFENYKKYVDGGKRQAYRSKTEFSWNKMVEVVDSVLTESIPEFPKEVQLELPKLQLPKLRKV